MDNVVIDTNCLIMAISSRSAYHKIWQSFLAGDYCLCISNEFLEEYAEVIARNISINVARYVVYIRNRSGLEFERFKRREWRLQTE